MANVMIVRVALLAVGLALFSVQGNAAVQELWRTGMTNGDFGVTYRAVAATVDTNGNTIVAGVHSGGGGESLFVATFNGEGNLVSEFNDTVEFRVYVDALNLTPAGDVIVIHRTHNGLGRVVSSISKISGDVRVWQRTEPNPFTDDAVAKASMDAAGNLFVLNNDAAEDPPGPYAPLFLSKIGPAGHEIWRTRLPFIHPGATQMPKPLALTDTGRLIVGGVYADFIPGAVTSVSVSSGKVQWIRRPQRIIDNYVAVAAGPKSICLSGQHGYVVYSYRGLRIAVRRDDRFISDRIELARDGGFMLSSSVQQDTTTVVSARGRLKWHEQLGVSAIGFFNDADEQYLAVGSLGGNANTLRFVRLNERGEQLWTEILEGFGSVSWAQRGTTALLAPDGTVRVVVNYSGFGARFKLLAFEVQN